MFGDKDKAQLLIRVGKLLEHPDQVAKNVPSITVASFLHAISCADNSRGILCLSGVLSTYEYKYHGNLRYPPKPTPPRNSRP